VAVADVLARDWEDISDGPCPGDARAQHCLYIADSGNNDRSRDVLTIYVVAEPNIAGATAEQPIVTRAQSFRYRYPNLTEDAEAIAVLPNGDVTIVTKGRTPEIGFFGLSQADVARAITSGEILTARYQGNAGIQPNQGLGRWVTAAAMSPNGTTLAVRTYSEIFFYSAESRGDGRRWRNLNRPCFLGDVEPQGEAIDYLDENTLLLASETSQGRQGTLHRVQC
jgi:hypothetical protein